MYNTALVNSQHTAVASSETHEMRIEAVITCNQYADFLEHTLQENLQHLDDVVVVTARADKDTQRVCSKLGVRFVDTNEFFDRGDKFNKARGIRLGLSHLRHDGWLAHMDADILLPHRFRQMLHMARLDEKKLYGADRLNSHSYEHWAANRHKTAPQYTYGYLVSAHGEFSLGSRLVHADYGYCPIGYFQLWHSSSRRTYPLNQGSAEHTDVLFALQWDRQDRVLLPEFFVFHLESEKAQMGANWQGRKTAPFKPKGPK